jgi:hypothetical protein
MCLPLVVLVLEHGRLLPNIYDTGLHMLKLLLSVLTVMPEPFGIGQTFRE